MNIVASTFDSNGFVVRVWEVSVSGGGVRNGTPVENGVRGS